RATSASGGVQGLAPSDGVETMTRAATAASETRAARIMGHLCPGRGVSVAAGTGTLAPAAAGLQWPPARLRKEPDSHAPRHQQRVLLRPPVIAAAQTHQAARCWRRGGR